MGLNIENNEIIPVNQNNIKIKLSYLSKNIQTPELNKKDTIVADSYNLLIHLNNSEAGKNIVNNGVIFFKSRLD